MITGFAIILDDEILYISNDYKYPVFEIVLFVEKLIRNINPKNVWRLKNIFFEGNEGRERMIIRHEVNDAFQNLFYCITGDFLSNSEAADNMLNEFFEKVMANYNNLNKYNEYSKKSEFSKVIKLITAYLWEKYRFPLEDEKLDYSYAQIENKIIYCGISAQGLPIISQLYDTTLLNDLHREVTHENIDLFSSNLSARLATIAMNTQIRANMNIKEIQFYDLAENGNKKLILFEDIHGYSLDFVASGDFNRIKDVFLQLKDKISKEEALKQEFSGDLKPYRSLINYLNEIIHEFDH